MCVPLWRRPARACAGRAAARGACSASAHTRTPHNPPHTQTHAHTHTTTTAALMLDVYEDHKDEDGFLYITYSGENTFGGAAVLAMC